jgi:hypothetical protein
MKSAQGAVGLDDAPPPRLAPWDLVTPRNSLDFASARMRDALTFIHGMEPPQPADEAPGWR